MSTAPRLVSSASEGVEPRSEGRRDRTRQQLIQAGERLFAGAAFASVAIEEIVASADVAKGTFYNHFRDKDDLLQAVAAGVRAEVRALITSEVEGLSDPARQVARAFCVAMRFRLEAPERAAFLARSEAPLVSVHDPINAGVASMIAGGLQAGTFRLQTTEIGVLLFHGLIAVATREYPSSPPEPFAAICKAQQLAAALLRALGAPADEADTLAAQEADAALRPYFDGLSARA